jgi:hypothetical protein
MIPNTVEELFNSIAAAISIDGDVVEIEDQRLVTEKIDQLVYTAVFGEGLVRDTARWLIWETGRKLGIFPSSIHELYMAAGRGDLPKLFTVPAMNICGH